MKLHDSGERSNRDLPGKTANAWSWVADTVSSTGSSAYVIRNGKICRKGDSKTGVVYPNKQLTSENQYFEFTDLGDFPAGSATLWCGIQLRMIDLSNYTLVRYNPPTGATSAQVVIQTVNGPSGNTVTVNIATPPQFFKFSGNIQKVANGNIVTTVFIDNVQVAQHTILAANALAWPASSAYPRGRVALHGYANSARLNESSVSFSMEDLMIRDLVETGNYDTSVWENGVEVPVDMENFYVEYVTGEKDPDYPDGLTSYPPRYTFTS